jgi:signal transduction histidine kinase
VSRLVALTKKYWFDAAIALDLALALNAVVGSQGKGVHHGPEGPLWLDVLITLAFFLPGFARRRFPFGALVTSAVVAGATSFADHSLAQNNGFYFVGAIFIAALFGMRPDRRQAVGGLLLIYVVSVVINANFASYSNDPKDTFGNAVGNVIWSIVTFTVLWVIGFTLGGRMREADVARRLALQAEQDREEQARLAVGEERARIARELHDVVGHSVSVMTVQAAAVRRLLEPDQDKEREALLVVEQTGREALAEMRRMVGVLRRPEEAPALAPQPSLEHLDRLVATTREAGLPVEVRVEGTPAQLPPALDSTAYRIVQEALNNAVKHANADRAEVVVRYGNGTVELIVSDDGRGDGDGGGSGHGLVGMRERVSVYGGELEAGPKAGGGFRLRATLPVT